MTGAIGTAGTNAITAGLKVVAMRDKIYLLEPEVAPLFVLASKLNKEAAPNPKIEWPEDELIPAWTTLSASISNSATSITVTDAYPNKYDLIKIPSTGEVMLVTAVSGTTLTVIRAYGTTSAASADSGASVMILGPAFAEGSTNTDLVTKGLAQTIQYNYLQEFRKAVEVTETMAKTEIYGGPLRDYERRKKGVELMAAIERVFMFGERLEDTGSKDSSLVHARRTSGGLNFFISTNRMDAQGALSEAEVETFLQKVFRYGSSTRYLFASALIMSVISSFARNKLQMFPKDTTYGIAITQWLSPHGEVYLIKENQLEHPIGGAETAHYAGYAFAVDLKEVIYRYLNGYDVQLRPDIHHPGDHVLKDEYYAIVGLEVHNEKKHGVLYGVTS